MSDECIHGFEDGMCAICNPKPVQETVAATRTATRTRAVSTPRAAARAAAGPSAANALLEQRIYHLTHLTNLVGIVEDGVIAAGVTPELELSPEQHRAERAEIEIPGGDRTLRDFVPFFLSPEASLWQSLRDGVPHPRLSAEARGADVFDFVFLVATVRALVTNETPFVLADGNAEGATTRFATTREDSERMLSRIRAMTDATALQGAELLVPAQVPLEDITLIGVANDRVRERVRGILSGSSVAPKIAVYPPWFQPAS